MPDYPAPWFVSSRTISYLFIIANNADCIQLNQCQIFYPAAAWFVRTRTMAGGGGFVNESQQQVQIIRATPIYMRGLQHLHHKKSLKSAYHFIQKRSCR